MMDITSLFKASVKTVQIRNKALGISKPADDPSRILKRPSKESNKFQSRLKEVVSNVSKLNDILTKNRQMYLDAGIQLSGNAPRLSQSDRADFDYTTEVIIKTCSQHLQELRKDNNALPANAHTREHRQMVIAVVEQYFRSVSKTYVELKEHYGKRQQELNRVIKFEGDVFRKSSFNSGSALNSPMDSPRDGAKVFSAGYNEDEDKTDDGRMDFTENEMQLFQKENALLYNELNSLNEEVNQIQGKVVKIAELQKTLTENVLDQEKVVERIAVTTVSATENIREGNEQLRQALQSSSGFRIAIIFFILVLFFSILFLDWYND